uniref:Morc S5 domain-containing protein n=1 Tax=Anguilla anguilla TaxID=7936 RepID=A0A0E9TJV0_ANGAN
MDADFDKRKKVKTQLVAKSLVPHRQGQIHAQIPERVYQLNLWVQNKSEGPYGVLMYYKNRLILPYTHLGCQLKTNAKGVGVHWCH